MTTMFIDWDDAFDNSSYVEGSEEFSQRWSIASETYRDNMASEGRVELDVEYDSGSRNKLDVFKCKGRHKGLVVFVHGGYWHKLNKSYWSFLAKGVTAHNWHMAIPSYTLAPDVRISHITEEIARAITKAAEKIDGPIRLIGHSAGGHLVSRMLCDDSPLDETVRRRLAYVIPVSGVYDLRPLMLTNMNQVLRLSEEEAASESAVLHDPLAQVHVTFWVGDNERPEFLRQTRLICEKWRGQSEHVHAIYEPGENHFSVIEGLANSESRIVSTLLR